MWRLLINLAFQVSGDWKYAPVFLPRENLAVASTDNGNFLKDIAYEIVNAKQTM